MKSVATVSVQVQEQLSDVWQVQQRNLFLIGGGTDLSDCCSPFQWSRLRFLIAHTFRRQYNTSGQIRFDCDWSMDTSPLFPSPSLSSSSSMSVDGCHCGNSLTHTHTHTLSYRILSGCVCVTEGETEGNTLTDPALTENFLLLCQVDFVMFVWLTVLSERSQYLISPQQTRAIRGKVRTWDKEPSH